MTIAAILGGKGGDVVTAATNQKVTEAVALLAERRIGAVPVLDEDGAVAGVFSERDVIYCLEREGTSALERQVSEVMTAPALTVEPGESVIAALALMTRRRIRSTIAESCVATSTVVPVRLIR